MKAFALIDFTEIPQHCVVTSDNTQQGCWKEVKGK